MEPVGVDMVEGRPTAVVAATATWDTFPALWRPMLDEVYACLRRTGAVPQGCNVMLYLENLGLRGLA